MKYRVFLIIFKGLSVAKSFLRPESPRVNIDLDFRRGLSQVSYRNIVLICLAKCTGKRFSRKILCCRYFPVNLVKCFRTVTL